MNRIIIVLSEKDLFDLPSDVRVFKNASNLSEKEKNKKNFYYVLLDNKHPITKNKKPITYIKSKTNESVLIETFTKTT